MLYRAGTSAFFASFILQPIPRRCLSSGPPHSGRAARSVPLLCRSLKSAGRDGAFGAQPGKPCSDLLPLDSHRVRTKEQGEMAACRCGQADLFARGPDQIAGTEELFGRCNLVRLAGEKVQRNPDHLEVDQAAERFKAARCQLVLPKELPDNLEVRTCTRNNYFATHADDRRSIVIGQELSSALRLIP